MHRFRIIPCALGLLGAVACSAEFDPEYALDRRYCEKVIECGGSIDLATCVAHMDEYSGISRYESGDMRTCALSISTAACGASIKSLSGCGASGLKLSTVGADPDCAPLYEDTTANADGGPDFRYFRFLSVSAYTCWSEKPGSPSGCKRDSYEYAYYCP